MNEIEGETRLKESNDNKLLPLIYHYNWSL